ncbi:MAG TPA: peptidylprolyl isomerase [Sphingobacteriaceae bacterium]|nr:peptidylprolyl isomerase [Sphingobacteriaceae bacterium]
MKKLIFILLVLTVNVFAAKPKHSFVRIKTNKGESVIMLYNQTPKHRDNFIKLTNAGYFNGTLFHRVIKDFMIQGGDPDSKNAPMEKALGDGGPAYLIDAEFRPDLFHKKGVLAAARDENPGKSSSGSQFYIVQGKVFTDAQLDQLEKNRLGRKLPVAHREVYKTVGGTPHLDQNYTVYGEVVNGLEMVDKITSTKTNASDRPLENIAMQVSLLKRREARKLEKAMNLADKP